MKKKILILGSTGSIGKSLIEILTSDKKNLNIKLLSTNSNISLVVKQALKFNVKNVIICNKVKYLEAKKKYINTKINFHNSFSVIKKLFKKKELFYSLISIVGLDGLLPSINLIRYSQNIAIANKESIICGWNLINKQLKKYKTNFIPIDSEHFSIYSLSINESSKIKKIFITGSGGPFFNKSIKQIKNAKIKDVLKHPKWKMGNKITTDSSTLMNKLFEVLEARKLFNINLKNIKVLIHPDSYVHAIVQFNNNLSKLLIHDPTMKIPLINSVYNDNNILFKKLKLSKKLNFKILNNLRFSNVDKKKFPLIKILDNFQDIDSLYETAVITINDFFVNRFLKKKINYYQMIFLIKKFCNHNDFLKFRKKRVNKINDIIKTKDYVLFKLNKLRV